MGKVRRQRVRYTGQRSRRAVFHAEGWGMFLEGGEYEVPLADAMAWVEPQASDQTDDAGNQLYLADFELVGRPRWVEEDQARSTDQAIRAASINRALGLGTDAVPAAPAGEDAEADAAPGDAEADAPAQEVE